MYAYRSRMAHGTAANFDDPELRVIRDRQTALTLLIETVKATMRYALDEPRLVVDLKDC